jgi:hypothetical protein
VRASATSIEDAASDAVLALLSSVRRFDKVKPQHWSSVRFLRVLAMFAGRAAFLSLASWSVGGMVGDGSFSKSDKRQYLASVEGLEASAAAAADTEDQAATSPEVATQTGKAFALRLESGRGSAVTEGDWRARVAAVRWVYRVGFFAVKESATGKGSAAAVAAALARCQVVGRVILGHSLIDACALSGFADVKCWVQSCKAAGFFESLKAARLAHSLDCSAVELARVSVRRYGLAAAAVPSRCRACS